MLLTFTEGDYKQTNARSIEVQLKANGLIGRSGGVGKILNQLMIVFVCTY